jgi:hypothetical protein
MIASAIPAAINPYSMAVAPLSSAIKQGAELHPAVCGNRGGMDGSPRIGIGTDFNRPKLQFLVSPQGSGRLDRELLACLRGIPANREACDKMQSSDYQGFEFTT